jgi:hypothetical protein
MTVRIIIVAGLTALGGCRRVEPAGRAEARTEARLDSAQLRLCAAPPDTSARGSGGCVLRDQGRVTVPMKAPRR